MNSDDFQTFVKNLVRAGCSVPAAFVDLLENPPSLRVAEETYTAAVRANADAILSDLSRTFVRIVPILRDYYEKTLGLPAGPIYPTTLAACLAGEDLDALLAVLYDLGTCIPLRIPAPGRIFTPPRVAANLPIRATVPVAFSSGAPLSLPRSVDALRRRLDETQRRYHQRRREQRTHSPRT